MHISVNGQLLNSGRHEETPGVLTDDLELEHAVHEGDPVVDPGQAPAGPFHVAADDAAEETAGGNERLTLILCDSRLGSKHRGLGYQVHVLNLYYS